MRKAMNDNVERLVKNVNSNEEIRKVCNANTQLKSALKESLAMPIGLLRNIFKNLHMKETTFDIYEPANDDEIK